MFGDFIVNSGKFNFTAQDYINKIFDLKEGGTVRWAGNPTEANININAIYQQRTSLAPLYNAAGREENPERVLAQADMILKGQLSQPDITFDINFPQNPGVKDELQGYFSDANNVNQQALSLIVRRSFTPEHKVILGKKSTIHYYQRAPKLLLIKSIISSHNHSISISLISILNH
ncbi:translocation/assembly module TamB domain-containing protein [Sphingobacterium sp. E70]|uniref:translocation/assembly module TamB domain-containing protein n=1 Tax=Sphingobacterium sp. E70 TaxID=2853439 RepID=UPI00359C5D29